MINALHFMFALGALACPLLVNRSLAWSGGLGPAAWVGAPVPRSLVAVRAAPAGRACAGRARGGRGSGAGAATRCCS